MSTEQSELFVVRNPLTLADYDTIMQLHQQGASYTALVFYRNFLLNRGNIISPSYSKSKHNVFLNALANVNVIHRCVFIHV